MYFVQKITTTTFNGEMLWLASRQEHYCTTLEHGHVSFLNLGDPRFLSHSQNRLLYDTLTVLNYHAKSDKAKVHLWRHDSHAYGIENISRSYTVPIMW